MNVYKYNWFIVFFISLGTYCSILYPINFQILSYIPIKADLLPK